MAEMTLRLDRIREILADAAQQSDPDRGGVAAYVAENGPFWDGGVDQLKTFRMWGVPMIGPTAETSGLIKALRGEPPFDGGQFPQLLPGGEPVPDTDIAVIADWIDDGCPDTGHLVDEPLGSAPEASTAEAGASTYTIREHEFAAFEGGVNAFAFRQTEVRQRANIDLIPEAQIEAFRDAMRQILKLNASPHDRRSYNNMALIHQNHCQHGWELFLPWHRAYMYEFEQNLRDFNPDVMLPYWDWTMPQYHPSDPGSGARIPNAQKAFLTAGAARDLIDALDPRPTATQIEAFEQLVSTRTLFYTQGDFLEWMVNVIGYVDVTPDPANRNRQRVIHALHVSNPLWYPLRYPGTYLDSDGNLSTINKVIQYHYPTADDIRQILSLNTFRDFGGGSMYNDSFGFLDQNPHNTMHIWTGGMNPYLKRASYETGDTAKRSDSPSTQSQRRYYTDQDLFSQPTYGDMFSNLTASYDPVFWPVHSNVDRLWWQWQQSHSGQPQNLEAVLSPWSYTIRDMLNIEPFGYEYVRGSYLIPVGYAQPVGRLVSAEISPPDGMAGFQRAEVRIHRVPELTQSCIVRVFLNDPGATAETPVDGNDHFAGHLSIFGHSECIGGPGHCAIPGQRPTDMRGRPHNMPRNHRIDVTRAAKQMLQQSDTLRVTLVVIGADNDAALKMEGLTLTFLD